MLTVPDFQEDNEGAVTVKSDTAYLYRFYDGTTMAESLYGWVRETVREELRRELEFVVGFRTIRREIESIVDMPDRLVNLFIKLCLQNRGRLSAAKRKSHFSSLSDQELEAMERVVQAHQGPLLANP